ncbi:APC family permease [Amphiplicatus metriothermophilus]|uniref:Amino acid/polyamine/organocation transporter, APC superfamily n=1 Tax=Amphiplicatus metriothermophilus TaxID=1519374 RepID=A0A239PVR5_9PROT|nr:APC family permease [Amphiplicatus metriothermophilus]MBB5519559.1 APA family basic amino acid/polyamine antiporter [Amphiplicatus metriothermophilus]SNT74123.1 amino acid/polyamine/organocation transporter, APC superfamily [Amphiplicatus metriothermophilus]
MQTTNKSSLRKGVSLPDIVSLGVGAAVGVSIFSVLAPATALAGPAMLIALPVAMTPMIIFAVVYGFMGSALPVSGASYEWPRRFIHPFAGFFISWLRIAGSAAALVVLAFVLVSYLSMVAPLPQKPVMFGIFSVVFVMNLLGVSIAAKGQTIMLTVLLATCAALAVTAAPAVDPGNFDPFLSKGWSGVMLAAPLMITLFLGIETATEVGEEVKNPGRNIPLGIGLAIALTTLLYLSVAVVSVGVLGEEALAGSSAPLLDVARAAMGRIGTPLIVLSATAAIGTSINAIFIIFTRYLFAMGRSGAFPSAIGAAHPGTGAPHVASATAYALCCAGLFLPTDLIFLFLAVNIPTLLKYAATSISATRLIDREPGLYEASAFRPPRPVVRFLGYLGAVAALALIAIGFSADWRPYALLAGWAALGALYYFLRARRRASSVEKSGVAAPPRRA